MAYYRIYAPAYVTFLDSPCCASLHTIPVVTRHSGCSTCFEPHLPWMTGRHWNGVQAGFILHLRKSHHILKLLVNLWFTCKRFSVLTEEKNKCCCYLTFTISMMAGENVIDSLYLKNKCMFQFCCWLVYLLCVMGVVPNLFCMANHQRQHRKEHANTSQRRTVHSENIQTPWLFSHFVTLQPYSKLIKYLFRLISLHTIPHNDKAKTGF